MTYGDILHHKFTFRIEKIGEIHLIDIDTGYDLLFEYYMLSADTDSLQIAGKKEVYTFCKSAENPDYYELNRLQLVRYEPVGDFLYLPGEVDIF